MADIVKKGETLDTIRKKIGEIVDPIREQIKQGKLPSFEGLRRNFSLIPFDKDW